MIKPQEICLTWCEGHHLLHPNPSKCLRSHSPSRTALWTKQWPHQSNLCTVTCGVTDLSGHFHDTANCWEYKHNTFTFLAWRASLIRLTCNPWHSCQPPSVWGVCHRCISCDHFQEPNPHHGRQSSPSWSPSRPPSSQYLVTWLGWRSHHWSLKKTENNKTQVKHNIVKLLVLFFLIYNSLEVKKTVYRTIKAQISKTFPSEKEKRLDYCYFSKFNLVLPLNDDGYHQSSLW